MGTVETELDIDLSAFWMPFSANRQFKRSPRLLVGAKDMHYTAQDGHKVLDGTAGLWCVNAGHGREKIINAVKAQLDRLDFAPTFQMGHPKAFEAAQKIAALAPVGFGHVFFANSGSEAVDSALKIALAYHRARGEGQRTVLIGRERGYHGTGFGGISVGGMSNNRKTFGNLLPRVDHLRHTWDIEHQAYSRGQPEWGAHFADELEQRIIPLHDASNIAAVIVEPVAGSTGGLIPPKGYLERLRAICDKHGLLLIFDEVITGFGRLGRPFGADYFGVTPDLMTFAKGVTSGVVPMGGVMVNNAVYDAFMQGPEAAIELFHGYTYSGHPLAAAAACATIDLYREEGLFERAAAIAPYFEQALHSLKGLPNVIDIRNLGLIGVIEVAARPGSVGARAFDVFVDCYANGLLVRPAGDTLALSPPLIVEKHHVDQMVDTLGAALKRAA
jgi:beta-alanine--pyruvate transaminase